MDNCEKMAFSIEEAALRSGLGRDKIYEEIRDGRLEARKAGRRTLIMADSLRKYLDQLPRLNLPPAAD